MRINMKRLMLGVGLVALSATAAAAVPAVVTTDLNLRSGPGTNYAVVGTLPSGATVDVGNCTGRWCVVNYGGEQGYASRSYLDLGAAGAVVVPGPTYGYVEPDYYYGDDYYEPGVTLGFGYYGGDRGHWRGRHHRGDWRGGYGGRHFGNRGPNVRAPQSEAFDGRRGGRAPMARSPGARSGQFSGGRSGGGTVGAGASVRGAGPSIGRSGPSASGAAAPSAGAPGGGAGAPGGGAGAPR